MDVLAQIDGWGAPTAAATVVGRDGRRLASHGPTDAVVRIASVTKLLTAYAVLIAVEEGTVALDEPAGPPGATVRHLLAHAAGYGFTGATPIARPGRRRIYSNTGIEVLAAHLEAAAGVPFADYLAEAVLTPLGMAASTLAGSPAHGLDSSVDDLARFAAELFAPSLIAADATGRSRSPASSGAQNGGDPGRLPAEASRQRRGHQSAEDPPSDPCPALAWR